MLACSCALVDGTLPDGLFALTKLTLLDVSFNQIGGQIPDAIGTATALKWLDLRSVSCLSLRAVDLLSTPAVLAACWLNWHSLLVEQNLLTGTLPLALSSLQFLAEPGFGLLNTCNNKFTGNQPSFVTNIDIVPWGSYVDTRITVLACQQFVPNQCQVRRSQCIVERAAGTL